MKNIESISEYSIADEKEDEDMLNPEQLATPHSKVDSTPAFSMIVHIDSENFALESPIQSPGS